MRNIFLIFRRDYLSYVQAWGFWFGLLALPILGGVAVFFSMLASTASPDRYYTVIDPTGQYAEAIEGEFARMFEDEVAQAAAIAEEVGLPVASTTEVTEDAGHADWRKFFIVDPPATSIDDLRPYLMGEKMVEGPLGPKSLFAAIIVKDGGNDIEYWSEDVNVGALRDTTRRSITRLSRRTAMVEAGLEADFLRKVDAGKPILSEKRVRSGPEQTSANAAVTIADRAPTWVAIGLAYILWLLIFSVIQYLLMGTIEERGNKIFDTLLTSVKLPHLLAGKLLAVFAVTATMMGAWGLTGGLGSAFLASAVPEMGSIIQPLIAPLFDASIIVPGLISFILGYIMYGVIFMAMGSLCDTIQEAQTLLSPMMILLMLPMLGILAAANDPSSPLLSIASWIPLFTPFLLIIRMPHDPPLWEVLAQLGIMALTTVFVLWIATKVYRAGAVNGAGVNDLGKWLKGLVGRKSESVSE